MRIASLVATVLILIVNCQLALAQALHVISVADTKDPTVGIEFGVNNAAIHDYVKSLSKTANLTLDLIDIKDESYSCDAIKKAVKDLSVKPDDVVIFYHSGHGRSPKRNANDRSGSIFPSLECAASLDDPIPNLEDLSNVLREKGARLTIVGADSCNKLVSQPQPPLAQVAPVPVPPERIRAMFRDFKGYILISSSSTDEYSFYPDNSIGIFTNQFIHALEHPPGVKPERLWSVVLSKATIAVAVPAHNPPPQEEQHPQHREELSYAPRSLPAAQ
jgi:hypothetical protein